jgi:hypothetical protein
MLQLTALGDGIVESLTVQHGLPCSLVIVESGNDISCSGGNL